MKISLALAGAVLLGTTLVGCGGDGGSGGKDSDYCKDLKASEKSISGLSSAGAKLEEAFPKFHKLAAEAPSDIESEWKTLDGALLSIEKALKDAGLSVADLDQIIAGKTPDDIDVEAMTKLSSEFQKLADADFTKASKKIEKHAKDVCKVTLKTS
ncbi:hypothetical protein [Aeromicrobium sp.]|uniref:hypothetical protein n=1 Tax=Aeromicrobium sp. TaxID=1871063 RepID=UPI0030C23259